MWPAERRRLVAETPKSMQREDATPARNGDGPSPTGSRVSGERDYSGRAGVTPICKVDPATANKAMHHSAPEWGEIISRLELAVELMKEGAA